VTHHDVVPETEADALLARLRAFEGRPSGPSTRAVAVAATPPIRNTVRGAITVKMTPPNAVAPISHAVITPPRAANTRPRSRSGVRTVNSVIAATLAKPTAMHTISARITLGTSGMPAEASL